MMEKAKGTSMENIIKGQSQAELSGAGMYFALARIAKEHNMDDVAERFTELAGEHMNQAGFYAVLASRYPYEEREFWQFIKGLSKAEETGEKIITGLARQMEEAGFPDSAETIRTFAAEHKHHAEVTGELVEKYAPEAVKHNSEKRYVCGICGYVYEGDLESEPEDFTCPLCGMPKDSFSLEK